MAGGKKYTDAEVAALPDAPAKRYTDAEVAKMPDAPEDKGMGDAALRGVASIAPFQAPLVGGLGAVLGGMLPNEAAKWLGVQRKDGEGFVDAYRRLRDETASGNDEALKNHPVAFLAPHVAGTVALAAATGGTTLPTRATFAPKLGLVTDESLAASRAASATQTARQASKVAGEAAGGTAAETLAASAPGLKTAAGLGAADAAGRSKADLTKGDVVQQLADTAAGAGGGLAGGMAGEAGGKVLTKVVDKVAESAPVRVMGRVLADLSKGAGGTAPKKARAAAEALFTEKPERLQDFFARKPDLVSTISKTAEHDPAAAVKAIDGETSSILKPLGDAYKQMTAHDEGGVPVGTVIGWIDKVRRSTAAMVNTGESKMEVPAAIEAYRLNLITKLKALDNDGNIPNDLRLSWDTIRGLKRSVAITAFPELKSDPAIKQATTKRLWSMFDNEIQTAAKRTPGVDASAIKQANQDLNILHTMEDTLDPRATNANTKTGRSLLDWLKLAAGSGAALVGGVTHGAEGAAEAAALVAGGLGAAKLGGKVLRATDAALARRALSSHPAAVGASLRPAGGALGPLTDQEVIDYAIKRKQAAGQAP